MASPSMISGLFIGWWPPSLPRPLFNSRCRVTAPLSRYRHVSRRRLNHVAVPIGVSKRHSLEQPSRVTREPAPGHASCARRRLDRPSQLWRAVRRGSSQSPAHRHSLPIRAALRQTRRRYIGRYRPLRKRVARPQRRGRLLRRKQPGAGLFGRRSRSRSHRRTPPVLVVPGSAGRSHGR